MESQHEDTQNKEINNEQSENPENTQKEEIKEPKPFIPKANETFNLSAENKKYNILAEYDDETIHFKTEDAEEYCSYENSYNLAALQEILDDENNFDGLMNIYKKAIEVNDANLMVQPEKIIFRIKRLLDYGVCLSDVELIKKKFSKDQIIERLLEEKKQFKEKIQNLEEENKKLKEELEKYK